MLDLSVIILTYNEEIHLKRCIENVQKFAKEIFIVDSYSTDKTTQIAEDMGAKVYQNKWQNNHSIQFNWALDNLPIQTEWVLRLDADEYLLDSLIEELNQKLPTLDKEFTGGVLKRRYIFMGKWVKAGIYPTQMLRLFKFGSARCEQRWMDEHIQLTTGKAFEFDQDFADHNLKSLGYWVQKHNGYAIREAIELINLEVDLLKAENEKGEGLASQAANKRKTKNKYAQQPLFWRSFIYFLYRYFFKLGFLEGKIGFLWNFLQGWWYRTLVDAKVFEIKQACGNDVSKMKQFIKTHYNINLD